MDAKRKHKGQHAVPVRLTLTEQAADYIRRGLADGRWQDVMPSEAELCRELAVSRGTLRTALAAVFKEGLLLPGGRGGRHQVVPHPGRRRRALRVPSGNLVRILSPQPRFIITGNTQIIFQTISEMLGRVGLNLEFEHHSGLWDLRKPEATLRKITSQPNTAGWLLYRSTEPVQRWFAQAGIPAVVLGGIYPDIWLSHAEFDLVAASRHAAGVFSARGHQRMAFLTVEKATAGDRACAEAFVAAAEALRARAEIVVFDDTVAGLCRALDGQLLAQPVPTAYLVAFPNHVPATVGHLTRRGLPVPKAAAVISRMDARLLVESIPSVARYEMDCERLGRDAARLLIKAVNPEVKSSVGQCVIMPEFVDGETAGGPGTL